MHSLEIQAAFRDLFRSILATEFYYDFAPLHRHIGMGFRYRQLLGAGTMNKEAHHQTAHQTQTGQVGNRSEGIFHENKLNQVGGNPPGTLLLITENALFLPILGMPSLTFRFCTMKSLLRILILSWGGILLTSQAQAQGFNLDIPSFFGGKNLSCSLTWPYNWQTDSLEAPYNHSAIWAVSYTHLTLPTTSRV